MARRPKVLRVVDRRGVLRVLRWSPRHRRYLFALNSGGNKGAGNPTGWMRR